MQEQNSFKDKLGRVIVSTSYIERERSDDEEWEEIEEEFGADQLVDKVHFSEIEDIKPRPESKPSTVLIKTGEKWRRLPMDSREEAEKVFKRLRYRYQAYLQNH